MSVDVVKVNAAIYSSPGINTSNTPPTLHPLLYTHSPPIAQLCSRSWRDVKSMLLPHPRTLLRSLDLRLNVQRLYVHRGRNVIPLARPELEVLVTTPEHNISAPVRIVRGGGVGGAEVGDVLHHSGGVGGADGDVGEPDGRDAVDAFVIFEEPAQVRNSGGRRLDVCPAIISQATVDAVAKGKGVGCY